MERLWKILNGFVPAERRADLQFGPRARFLVIAAGVTALAGIFPIVSRIRGGADPAWQVMAALVWILVAAVPWVLRWTRSLRVAGTLYLAVMIAGLPALGYRVGFFPPPVLYWLVAVPLAGALFVNWRLGLAAAGLGITAMAVLWARLPGPQVAGADLEEAGWRLNYLITAATAVALVGLLAWAFEIIVRRGFDRATGLAERLRRANRELDAARRAAEEANREKSRFLANMSHEFRTPLNAIIGYSELLIEEAGEGAASPELRNIRDSGQHILALVDDVLDIAKIESGKIELELSRVDLGDLVEEVRRIAAPQARANRNALTVELAPGLPPVETDRTRLRQILLNLLSNASKFTAGGSVRLEVGPARGGAFEGVGFRVVDTGIGIAPEKLERVFEPFRQADESTTRRYGGTGLGLGLSRQFAELLGGSIAVESEPGAGSTFTVEIPLRPPPAGEADRGGAEKAKGGDRERE